MEPIELSLPYSVMVSRRGNRRKKKSLVVTERPAAIPEFSALNFGRSSVAKRLEM